MTADLVGDARFFRAAGPFTLAAIAGAAGLALPSDSAQTAGSRYFRGVAPLVGACPDQVSFLDNPRYGAQLAETQAGAVVLAPSLVARLPAGCIALPAPDPYLAWARICTLFYPSPPVRPGRHPSAVIAETADIDPSAEIGPLAVIGDGASIGPDCVLGPHVVIGPGVVLGPGCVIGAGATVSHALLGARVRLLPGARIGQEGFGFAPDGQGGYFSVPQLGRVVLGDDVEIGANVTIDRGSMRDTQIGAGCRIDNLVQLGHNVQLGRGCVIVSLAGISGSTILGDHVQVAGQAGFAGHLRIGDRARIGAQAGVMEDVPAGASIVGSPAQPAREFFQHVLALRRLAAAELRRGRMRSEGKPAGADPSESGQKPS